MSVHIYDVSLLCTNGGVRFLETELYFLWKWLWSFLYTFVFERSFWKSRSSTVLLYAKGLSCTSNSSSVYKYSSLRMRLFIDKLSIRLIKILTYYTLHLNVIFFIFKVTASNPLRIRYTTFYKSLFHVFRVKESFVVSNSLKDSFIRRTYIHNFYCILINLLFALLVTSKRSI